MEFWWVILIATFLECGNVDCACSDPPEIGNGEVLPRGTYVDGDIVVYDCDDGYELNGTRSAVCTSSAWVPEGNLGFPPTCKYNSFQDRYYVSNNKYDEMPEWLEIELIVGIIALLLIVALFLGLSIYCCCKINSGPGVRPMQRNQFGGEFTDTYPQKRPPPRDDGAYYMPHDNFNPNSFQNPAYDTKLSGYPSKFVDASVY